MIDLERYDFGPADLEPDDPPLNASTCVECGHQWDPHVIPATRYEPAEPRYPECPRCGGDAQ